MECVDLFTSWLCVAEQQVHIWTEKAIWWGAGTGGWRTWSHGQSFPTQCLQVYFRGQFCGKTNQSEIKKNHRSQESKKKKTIPNSIFQHWGPHLSLRWTVWVGCCLSQRCCCTRPSACPQWVCCLLWGSPAEPHPLIRKTRKEILSLLYYFSCSNFNLSFTHEA